MLKNIVWLSRKYNKKYVGFMNPLAKQVPEPWAGLLFSSLIGLFVSCVKWLLRVGRCNTSFSSFITIRLYCHKWQLLHHVLKLAEDLKQKKNNCGHCMKQRRQGPDAELVMKGKPLHYLHYLVHIACKAKEKKLCASWSQWTKTLKL